MFAGAVVFDPVPSNELFTDGDLEVVPDDGDLDLTAPELVPGPVAGAGEADVPGRVDFAGHGRHRHCRPLLRFFAAHGSGDPGCLLGGVVSAGVGRDEHATVMDLHEPAITDEVIQPAETTLADQHHIAVPAEHPWGHYADNRRPAATILLPPRGFVGQPAAAMSP